MICGARVGEARRRYRQMASVLNEQSRRRFVALEAQSLGHGGVSAMSRISGLARSTIYRGFSDVSHKVSAPPGRMRKPGGGRKSKVSQDPTLVSDLEALVEPVTRGDPMQPLLWTSMSLRNLARELAAMGHEVCADVVGGLLREMGYQPASQPQDAGRRPHIDRDAQFHYINDAVKAALAPSEPTISVDTKKKELVGDFKNAGREWRPKGKPIRSMCTTSRSKLGRAVPYGVYDIAANSAGSASGSTTIPRASPSTPSAAGGRTIGRERYPARRLMITADGGGSNGSRVRLWKFELQKLADELGLTIKVCHCPPGTSRGVGRRDCTSGLSQNGA